MKQINYLTSMYADSYYPKHLVDQIKAFIEQVVEYLEQGPHAEEEIQAKLDQMTLAINDLQDEFYEQNSELETVARDSIAETVIEILQAYDLQIDIEEALRERDW